MDQSSKYRIEYPNLYAESELLNTYDKYEVDYICQVAGITFENEDGEYRQQIISDYFRKTSPGPANKTELSLEPDPYNRYDSNAVKVLLDGKQIGFVPSDLAKVIRPLIKEYKHLSFGRFSHWENGYSCQLTVCFANKELPTALNPWLPYDKDLPRSCYSDEVWKYKTEQERAAHTYYKGGGTRAAYDAGSPEGFVHYTDKKYAPTYTRVLGAIGPGLLYGGIAYYIFSLLGITFDSYSDKSVMYYFPLIIGYIIALLIEFRCSTREQKLIFGTTWRGLLYTIPLYLILKSLSVPAGMLWSVLIGFLLGFARTIHKITSLSYKEIWKYRSAVIEDLKH